MASFRRTHGKLPDMRLENWSGYNGEQPVRIGNAAVLHSQHDIYGEMVLALTPRMWGDSPLTYSHVGLIHAAFAASPRWTGVL